MKNDPIRTKVLSIRLIPNADRFLLKAMQVQEGHRSLGLITTQHLWALCRLSLPVSAWHSHRAAVTWQDLPSHYSLASSWLWSVVSGWPTAQRNLIRPRIRNSFSKSNVKNIHPFSLQTHILRREMFAARKDGYFLLFFENLTYIVDTNQITYSL